MIRGNRAVLEHKTRGRTLRLFAGRPVRSLISEGLKSRTRPLGIQGMRQRPRMDHSEK
jgi:hypothetical protein